LNILFVGSGYINSTSVQLSRCIAANPEIKHAGFIDSFQHIITHFKKKDGRILEKFYEQKQVIDLSFFFSPFPFKIDEFFDVIFIEQNGFKFKNDILDVDVIYYHRDIPNDLFMEDMDILLYRFKKHERKIAREYPKLWGNGITKQRFLNGVEMRAFDYTKERIHKGINWIGWKNTWKYYWDRPSQKAYYLHVRGIVNFARKHNLVKYHEHGIPYPEYKDILEQSEAVLIIPGTEAYVTRKIYEAASSKTMIVLYVQNDEGEQIYNEMGLVHEVNCLMFHSNEELRKLKKKYRTYNRKLITQNAYNWVKENHTWDLRAKELIEIYKNYKLKKEEVEKCQIITRKN